MKVKSGTEKETALGIPRREGVEPEEGEKRGLGRAGGRQTGRDVERPGPRGSRWRAAPQELGALRGGRRRG